MLGLLDADEPSPEPRRRAAHSAATLELSVVLPARNEEQNLAACLDSLLLQSEPGFVLGQQWEIIIVDDDSSDRTLAIALTASAATETGVRVLQAPAQGVRVSMTGKNNACWAGAQAAAGGRLLFLDADTVLELNALSRSLREAERHELALLSYSPRQSLTGLAQRLVMPLIFSELASIYPPQQVSDPTNALAAANGQFLLVERTAYFEAGGHRALGLNILEDVALARTLKRAGNYIRLRYAPEALSTHMYRTNGAMIEGWTKNLASLVPSPVALALWRVLDLLLLFGLPVLAGGVAHLVFWQRGALLLLWLRTGLRFYTRVARAHFGPGETAISPFGLPLLIFLLLRSVAAYRLQRRVLWRGRSYDPNRM